LEGADVLINYHPDEEEDAQDTKKYIEKVASKIKVELAPQDLRTEDGCLKLVEKVKTWSGGVVDVLCAPFLLSTWCCQRSRKENRVNNAATQIEVPKIEDLPSERESQRNRPSLAQWTQPCHLLSHQKYSSNDAMGRIHHQQVSPGNPKSNDS